MSDVSLSINEWFPLENDIKDNLSEAITKFLFYSIQDSISVDKDLFEISQNWFNLSEKDNLPVGNQYEIQHSENISYIMNSLSNITNDETLDKQKVFEMIIKRITDPNLMFTIREDLIGNNK